MTVRVRDLPNLLPRVSLDAHPVFLYCRACGAEYSAHAGDYFTSRPDHVLTCCDEPMILAEQTTTIREVTPKSPL